MENDHMEKTFKKYLNETELAFKQPVEGDQVVFTINETLDIEADVVQHTNGTILLNLDNIALNILEDCGCILEDEQIYVAGRDFEIMPDLEYHGYVMGDETIADPDNFNKIGYGIYKQQNGRQYIRVGDVVDPRTGKYFGPYPDKYANAKDAFMYSVDNIANLDEQGYVSGPLRSGTDTMGPKTGMSSNPDTLYTNTPTATPAASATSTSTPAINIGSTAKGGERQMPSSPIASSDMDSAMFSGNDGANLQKLAATRNPSVAKTTTLNVPLPQQKPTPQPSRPPRPEHSGTGKMPKPGPPANVPTGLPNPMLAPTLAAAAGRTPSPSPSSRSVPGHETKPPPNIPGAKGPSTGGSPPYLREDINDLKKLSGIVITEAVKENIKKTDIKKIKDISLSQQPDSALEEDDEVFEAKYQGREVTLGKPTRGDVKKYKVYVRDPKTGNIKKVNFGDKNMEIKRDNPERRKSFRARHNCSQKKDRTTAGYWSCRLWSSKPVSKIVKE